MNRDFISVLSLSVTCTLLAGCGGSQPPIGGAGAMSQGATTQARAHRETSWTKPEASSDNLVYITQGDTVGIYSFSGQKVGALTGLSRASAICSDGQGNVWVNYGGSLLEYAHGGTIPIAQLYAPGDALSCAVDPTTGDIAVAESLQSGENVAVFHDIYGTPQIYAASNIWEYLYLSYDDQGNLFANGTYKRHPHFAELLKGAQEFSPITVDEKFRRLGGLQWYGQYLALADSLSHVIYQMSVVSGHAATQSTTHFKGWRPKFKEIAPFAIRDGVIVLAYSTDAGGYFNFPQGGRPIHNMAAGSSGGIAISVVPSRRVGSIGRSGLGRPSTTRSRSWIRRGASTGALLYTNTSGAVLMYSYPQAEFVGRLDAVGEPTCSDSAGNVFLRSRNAITEYAHGSSTPIETLRIPGAEIYACSVDPITQNLAVVFSCPPCGYQDLAIFPNESGTPTRYKTGTSAPTCGYDGSSNLFITDANSETSLSELPAGSSELMTVTLDKGVAAGQVQWDGKHITLQSRGNPFSIYPIAVSGSTGSVLRPTTFRTSMVWVNWSWIYDGAVAFSFNKHDEPPKVIGVWKYPQGGRATRVVKKIPYGGVGFGSVVVSAAPSR